ncbi:MAG TPA: hypothetical protein VGB14_16240 [Acidimicrobiales bacterium]|jgi:hypothetical protein
MTRHRFGLGEWFVLVAAAALVVLALLAPAAGAQTSDGGAAGGLDFGSVAVFLAVAAPIVKKAVDLIRMVAGRDWTGVVTQAVAWTGSTVVVWLVAASDFADQLGVDISGVASVVLIGLTVGSSASLFNDFLVARDNTQTAALPRLDGSRQPPIR